MNNYEVLYVIDGTLSDEAIKGQVTKFTELVTANGGEIVQVDEWGKRRLAYQINYKSEGYYVLMNFKSEPDFPAELERNFGINESIMRYMVERKSDEYAPPKKIARPKIVKKTAEASEAKPDESATAESEAPIEADQEIPAEEEKEVQAEEETKTEE